MLKDVILCLYCAYWWMVYRRTCYTLY